MSDLQADLAHILTITHSLWEELRDARIFITGGTGFFGAWLLKSFAYANDILNLNARAVVLTRNRTQVSEQTCISYHHGDIRNFTFPDGEFSHLIHAATEASATLNDNNPQEMLQVITDGAQRIIEFAHEAQVKKMLFTSSGAVYGPQPSDLTHLPETYAPQNIAAEKYNAYAYGKRYAEQLFLNSGLPVKVARCFAFVGPYLPLTIHFAVGNFIHDVLTTDTIHIKGDGTPHRSYLYAADLAIWLWTILFNGEIGRAYNVGSADSLNLRTVAELIAENFTPKKKIQVDQISAGGPPARYVPCIKRAQQELRLTPTISLDAAIKRTLQFYQTRIS